MASTKDGEMIHSHADIGIDDGPKAWRIWRAMLAGAANADGWESLIYSDAHFQGEITEGLGPFQIFGTLADPLRDALAPRIVLRVQWHDPGTAPKRSKTKIRNEGTRWLALNLDAEIACLLSLIAGLRVRSGGQSRAFTNGDPTGRPIYATHSAPAALEPQFRAPMLSGLTGARISVHALKRQLSEYPLLEAQDATTLARAARQYSTALWVAESDPELSWIQLVSALETVASRWKVTSAQPVELFTEHFPEPARILRESDGGISLLGEVAPHFTKLIGAARRFEEFIETFKPDPPNPRPVSAQVEWGDLRPVSKVIYKHRSALLHDGTPLPADLCVPPLLIDGIPEERPIGHSSTSGNTTWPVSDTPIRLHTFAHLTRGAILNWWADILAA